MAPYHGIITAGLRNRRRYAVNTVMPVPHLPPLNYRSPVKHLQKLNPPVVLSFPNQRDMIMPSHEVSRNLPGIHHQARERGNPRIDFMDIFASSFEHINDPEKLSEAGLWVYEVIGSLEDTSYGFDPLGARIMQPTNPFYVRYEDLAYAQAMGNQALEELAARQIINLFQAVSDILLEDKRLGVYDGALAFEFIQTALYFAPIISEVLEGAGVLMLLRAVALMSEHDVDTIKQLIQTIPFHAQRDLYYWAERYWVEEKKELGKLIVLIFRGMI